MRKLGLDVGSKSCGFAVSDELNITAQGKENFRFEEKDWEVLITRINHYLKEYEIDVIVVGYPTYPSGDKSETTYMIEEFLEILKVNTELRVITLDENGTTKKANEIMIKAGLTREKRKLFKDQIAAQLILEDYLSRI